MACHALWRFVEITTQICIIHITCFMSAAMSLSSSSYIRDFAAMIITIKCNVSAGNGDKSYYKPLESMEQTCQSNEDTVNVADLCSSRVYSSTNMVSIVFT